MTTLILTEKPSVARLYSEMMTNDENHINQLINYKNEKYYIVHSRGSLFNLNNPEKMVSENLKEKYSSFELRDLDWHWRDFTNLHYLPAKSINRKTGKDMNKVLLEKIEQGIKRTDITEIAIATDLDPYGQGDLIAATIIEHFTKKYHISPTITRINHESEVLDDLRYALDNRKEMPLDKNIAYKKATTRELWDFVSIALSRIAAAATNRVLGMIRIGRLKSYILNKIGNQFLARKQYNPSTIFTDRLFNEKYKIKLKRKNEETFKTRNEVLLPEDNNFTGIIIEIRNRKKQPPELYDLNTLIGDIRAKNKQYSDVEIINKYQEMYEGRENHVSYPRTSDTTITQSQFDELLSHKSEIANLLGISEDKLPITKGRNKYIHTPKNENDVNSHGANRIGKTIPKSIDEISEKYGELGKIIYQTLLVKTAVMFAEDHQFTTAYIQSKAFENDYYGQINYQTILQKNKFSYKNIISLAHGADTSEVIDNTQITEYNELTEEIVSEIIDFSTGEMLDFVFIIDEIKSKKPIKPTGKWLSQQLKKDNVGTGATRSESLIILKGLKETKANRANQTYIIEKEDGELTLSKKGFLAYEITLGSMIASKEETKKLLKNLDTITVENFESKHVEIMDSIEHVIQHDKQIFQQRYEEITTNPDSETQELMKEFNLVAKTFKKFVDKNGIERQYNDLGIGTYRFSEEEKQRLENGEVIEINYQSDKDGKIYRMRGQLKEHTYKNKQIYGFQFESNQIDFKHQLFGDIKISKNYGNHTYSQDELTKLGQGIEITFETAFDDGVTQTVTGKIEKVKKAGRISYRFIGKTSDRHYINHVKYGYISFKKRCTLYNGYGFATNITEDKLKKIANNEPILMKFTNKDGSKSEILNVILAKISSQENFSSYYAFKKVKTS